MNYLVKATYTGEGGWPFERPHANKVFIQGGSYNVIRAVVGQSSTHITIDGIEGMWNHCLFDFDPEDVRNMLEGRFKQLLLMDIPDTPLEEHQNLVTEVIDTISEALYDRVAEHDKSKSKSPEKELFEIYQPLLKDSTYGSEEYDRNMAGLKQALDHHYEVNRHHPEHFENGVRDMTIVDLIEMFADWCAATHKHEDGNIYKSLEHNDKRFVLGYTLKKIFENTVREYKLGKGADTHLNDVEDKMYVLGLAVKRIFESKAETEHTLIVVPRIYSFGCAENVIGDDSIHITFGIDGPYEQNSYYKLIKEHINNKTKIKFLIHDYTESHGYVCTVTDVVPKYNINARTLLGLTVYGKVSKEDRKAQ